MPPRPVFAFSLLALAGACTAVPVEEGDQRNQALARLCGDTIAASLKIDRKAVTPRAVSSVPEGDEVTVDIPGGSMRCYVGLDGKVFEINYLSAPSPPEAQTEAPLQAG
jgi:allophanate hydrolase subunit 2